MITIGLQESLSFGADFRRQNLLMDVALLPFQIELDKQLQPFYDVLLKAINSDSTIEVETCLKESHLWKCRQLGVDSPIVLVFTMLYFNTKYFRLYTAEQHLEMSFRNVQKVAKNTVVSTLGISNGSSSKNAAKIFSLQFEHFKTEKDRGKFPVSVCWFRYTKYATLFQMQTLHAVSNGRKPWRCHRTLMI